MLVLAMEFSRGLWTERLDVAVLGQERQEASPRLALPVCFPTRSNAPRKRNRDEPGRWLSGLGGRSLNMPGT
jgi:hypothetical protein